MACARVSVPHQPLQRRPGEFQMQKIEETRQAVEAIARASGDLRHRYHEAEALGLIRALGRYCPATERSLIGATLQQQEARRAVHAMCACIEDAIRRAVAQPDRPEHQQMVVEQVGKLYSVTRSARLQFGWPEPGRH
jgi:hypothetical protein